MDSNSISYNKEIGRQKTKNNKETIRPSVGNLLIRTDVNNNQSKYYVVCIVSQKSDIINKIALYEIESYDKVTNQFKINKKSTFTLTLSSACTWFTKDMLEKFNWNWYNGEFNFF